MTFELTDEQELWLNELETTGKKRGARRLSCDGKFCCLGLYADMKAGGGECVREEGPYGSNYDGDNQILTRFLWEQLRLNDGRGRFKDNKTGDLVSRTFGAKHYLSLANLNDGLSLKKYPTFKEIAAFIRENARYIFNNGEQK